MFSGSLELHQSSLSHRVLMAAVLGFGADCERIVAISKCQHPYSSSEARIGHPWPYSKDRTDCLHSRITLGLQ